MTVHVHICPVGFYTAPILDSVNVMRADKYYFLYNENEKVLETLDEVEDALSRLGYTDLRRVVVDAFDYQSVVNTIMRIHHEERTLNPDSVFYINFTSGTKIMAGACCNCAALIGATLYYVMIEEYAPDASRTERVRVVSPARVPDADRLNGRPAEILRMICDSEDGVSIRHLSRMLQVSPQNINYHLNKFLEQGLICKERDGRSVVIKGTETGMMLRQWMLEGEGSRRCEGRNLL